MFHDGQQLGGFEILERLGEGAMGAVYKARQTSLHRLVALKTLQPVYAENAEFIARFRGEASAAASLNHPNLVQVYSAGETDGLHWFAMEFVIGETAQGRLERKGPLPPAEAIAIGVNVASALDYGWQTAQLIHRDIKPANIFLSRRGEVKLGDLGLAKMLGAAEAMPSGSTNDISFYISPELTRTGAAMGTPYYVSPEQALGKKDVGLRADIYSLGCTIFHLLTGQPPYRGDTAIAVMNQHVRAPVPDIRKVWPECPPALAVVLAKAMQKLPAQRYRSHAEFKAELIRAHNVPIPVAIASTQPLRKATPPGVWITAGIALLAAVAALFYFAPWKKGARPSEPAQLSEAERADKERTAQVPSSEGGKIAGDSNRRATENSGINVSFPGITKDAPLVNSLGMKFVPVPGTDILMCIHETRKGDYAVYAAQNANVDDSWKSSTRGGVPVSTGEDHPVVNVSWEDAKAFCDWLGGKEGRSYRLPTDREWSIAVGIGDLEENGASPESLSKKLTNVFPWGSEWPPPKDAGNFADSALKEASPSYKVIENYRDGFATTSPVMSFPPNKLGIYDLSGNVWEWCEDWFNATHTNRYLRGGSYHDSSPSGMFSSGRYPRPVNFRLNVHGFRCVIESASPPGTGSSTLVKNDGLPQSNTALNGPWSLPSRRAVVTPFLKDIEFPTTTDEKSLRNYAKALLAFNPRTNNGREDIGDKERQDLLLDLAERDFDLVLSEVKQEGPIINYSTQDAVIKVVTKLADDRHKAAIIKAFEHYYPLAAVISKMNWVGEASPSMVAAIRNYNAVSEIGAKEIAFFSTCFQSEDDTVWKELEHFFCDPAFVVSFGIYKRAVGQMQSLAPDAMKRREQRLEHLVLARWETAGKSDSSWWLLSAAQEAAKIGRRDALDLLGRFLMTGNPPVTTYYQVDNKTIIAMQKEPAACVISLTDCPASSSYLEAGNWVMAHIGSLQWDSQKKRFVSGVAPTMSTPEANPALPPKPAPGPAAVLTKAYADLTAADIAGMAAQLSTDKIDGSDGQQFLRGTYFIYKTRNGRFGKCNVDELKGSSLVLSWITFEGDGSIHSSGHNLTVGTSFSCDLDAGLVPTGPTGGQEEFFFHGVNQTTRYIVPGRGRFKVFRPIPAGK